MQYPICGFAGRKRTLPANLSSVKLLFLRSFYISIKTLPSPEEHVKSPSLSTLDELLRKQDDLHRYEKIRNRRWPWSMFQQAPKNETKQKKYILPMFPYPSGDLHLGHLRVYTISDVLARFHRMQGYDVMHPIGWDAFGLPAENAAIERGIDPAEWTAKNIQKMKGQLRLMNSAWDWDKEFATCDPKIYKHTQRLFLLLHKAGLAYQAESLVNYDPVDKTVLANEQVDANGCSWRSGAKVEKKMLKQWFFKITHFRQELLDDLKILERDGAWPERVLAMQKNWLGKSTGAKIKFPVVAYDQQTHSDIEVFTTRPDTLFGVQYLALASTHPIVQSLAKTDVELQAFLDTIPALPEDSKVGYLLPHLQALNPLSYEESTPEATKASLPIYVAPYVLGDYGDGAVMGVPGHDTRDHAFWRHNRYKDPVRIVISQSPDEATTVLPRKPYVHHGHLTKNSGPYAGLSTDQATKKIIDSLQAKSLGSAAETWRLRDWLVSRQRYWGTPIPIIHCDSCGPVPVPENQLPVLLPPVQDHWGKGKTGNPLEHAHDWLNTRCPECGGAAKRDTDTMDTFVDSSWYFMRFPDAKNEDLLFSPDAANANLPVDIYVGGVEHAILHLLYARFISKFLATTPHWPEGAKHAGEPFKKILTQGMVHGKTYSDPSSGRFLKPNEVDLADVSHPKVAETGQKALVSFEKMSKSKYNGVDPETCISKYGADATRAHILFQAPVSEVLEWNEERILGITRWLNRLVELVSPPIKYRNYAAVDRRLAFTARSELTTSAEQLEYVEDGGKVLDFDELRAARVQYKPEDWRRLSEQYGKRVPINPEAWRLVENGFEADKALWRTVQGTIISVTESYSKSYSLNTVVSDLMTLTNAIFDHKTQRHVAETPNRAALLHYHAVTTLLKLMAPITPAVAEYGWEKVNPERTTPYRYFLDCTSVKIIDIGLKILRSSLRGEVITSVRGPGSIFDQPFPTPDGTYEMLGPSTQTCAVQVNGKLRVAVEIPNPPSRLAGEELRKWLVVEILKTTIGKERLMGFHNKGKPQVDIRKSKRTIVVKGGKTVNFIV